MSDIVGCDFMKMNGISAEFAQQMARVKRVEAELRQHLAILQRGGWISDAANRFYGEMNSNVMPAIDRLEKAMGEGQRVTQEIANLFAQADEEASTFLPKE